MGVNSLPKTVTRQRRGCNLNPGPTAPESSTLTTRLPVGCAGGLESGCAVHLVSLTAACVCVRACVRACVFVGSAV